MKRPDFRSFFIKHILTSLKKNLHSFVNVILNESGGILCLQSTMIYALVTNRNAKCKEKDEESFFAGSLAVVIDEYLYCHSVDAKILKKLSVNDTLVVGDIGALGGSLSEIVERLKLISEYQINLILVKENLSFKADKLPEIATSLLIASRLHQSLISLRSHRALQKKKAKGIKLGRPYDSNSALKLDGNKEEIQKLLLSGVSKDKIAEKFNVCRATVYNFVKKNPEVMMGEEL